MTHEEYKELLSKPWFTDKQALIVAADMQEADATMGEAAGYGPYPAWKDLSDSQRAKWIERARTELASMSPLDITRPIKLREGTALENVRLSDDGLEIIAYVPAWRTEAKWPITGCGDDGDSHPRDLVYA